MVDVDSLSDAELRAKLIEFGFPVMPITGSTRKLMVKKLKLLLENKNKIGKDDRRSLGRYSSEDESDTDTKKTKKLNKRQTIAAPLMQPPSSSRVATSRKSTRFVDTASSGGDSAAAVTAAAVAAAAAGLKTVKTTTTTTRTTRILENAKDEFDTGSESDEVSDNIATTSTSWQQRKPESPVKLGLGGRTTESSSFNSSSGSGGGNTINRLSPGRLPSSFIAASTAAEQAADRISQIRSRYSSINSSYDKPLYTSSPAIDDPLKDKENTPFLSNFTKRLSQLSPESQKSSYDYKSDIIKENDVNGSSSGLTRNYLSSYRASRGRPSVYDYQKPSNSSIFKNNFVPLMVLIVAFLFFIVVAVTYLGIRSDSPYEISATVPRCNIDDTMRKNIYCIMDDETEGAINMFKVLKPELNKRAVHHLCINGLSKQYMTEQEIVDYIKANYALKDESKLLSHLRTLEFLLFYNPNWGLSVIQMDKDKNNEQFHSGMYAADMPEVHQNRGLKQIGLISANPPIPWKCYIYNKVSAIINILSSIIGGVLLFYGINYGYKRYKLYRQKQHEEEVTMVENIIDILQSLCGEDNFLVINHIRDMILPVHDRKSKEKTWQRAVKYINENESRIRTEIQVVRGEPSEVWRWLGGPNLSTSKSNNSWQGQAFETQINNLNCSPTPCLKIRGMVEEGDRNTNAIKQAVLNKCAQDCRILHCGVDTNTNCVYLKCADPKDATIAFRNLHGWWYSGNLVTVKYLRLERYMQRFPDSPVSGPPYLQ